MSSSNYKRATKKFPARIDHTDGSVTVGAVLVPVGTDFVATITQSTGFIQFETDEGEETYLNIASVKRITETDTKPQEEPKPDPSNTTAEQRAETARQDTRRRAEAASRMRENTASGPKKTSPYTTVEQHQALDALGLGEFATRDEIQSSYRRLVKLYHPDRLRGLGVAENKINYAAEKLAEINNAYRLLMRVAEAA